MPTETAERWIQDGRGLRDRLEAAGYEVILQYANSDVPTQRSQVDRMIAQDCEVLIISAIEGGALGAQLDNAASNGVKVIAYDRLLLDSEHVDFFVSFDNFEVGVAQGRSLLEGLGIDTGAQGPFNIEVFAGVLSDDNTRHFFDGSMHVLTPYIDSGVLEIRSGEVTLEECAVSRWRAEAAQQRMETILDAYYVDDELHGVLSPYDGLSRGVIAALESRGYTGEMMPPVTGQDADIVSVKLIVEGLQYSTIFKDTRELSQRAVESAVALLSGEQPETNDTETYYNGAKVVPAYLLDFVTVTGENVQSALVETGYWTQQQIDSGNG